MLHRIQVRLVLLLLVSIAASAPGGAQERVKIADLLPLLLEKIR